MYQLEVPELPNHAITVTWCSCVVCAAPGPTVMTFDKNGRVVNIALTRKCCNATASCGDSLEDD